MYMTIRRYTAKKGTVRELAKRLEQTFLPTLDSISGFVSYSLVDGGNEGGRDVLVTITSCETRDGVDESIRRAATWVKSNAAEFDVTAPVVTTGEVAVTSSKKQGATAH